MYALYFIAGTRQSGRQVYVSGLPDDVSEIDIERAFERCGFLRSVWLSRDPAGFAFITFEHARNAEKAVKDMNGR